MVFFLPSNSHQPNSTIPHPRVGGMREKAVARRKKLNLAILFLCSLGPVFLSLSLTSSVSLGKLFNLSVPQFP